MMELGGRIQDAFFLSAGGRVGVLWVSSFGLVVESSWAGCLFVFNGTLLGGESRDDMFGKGGKTQ